MTEFVLGTGQKASIRDVARAVEHQLRRTQGVPRVLDARADNCEFLAMRPDFDADFNAFTLRLRCSERRQEALREVAAQHANACTYEEQEGVMTFYCPGEGQAPGEAALAAADALSGAVRLPEVWRVHGEQYRIDRLSVEKLFKSLMNNKASDLHLSPGGKPVLRIDGDTHAADIAGELSALQINALIRELAPDDAWEEFQQTKQTSFNFHQIGMGYSRISAFMKSGAPHLTLRFLPEKIPSFDDLNIPSEPLHALGALHHGMVLIAGMTGSGKTTTAAALLDWINEHYEKHILSIENPVEYVHESKKAIISQRMLGVDVETFNLAVVGALRHDPDVLFIGEMRDPDTIRAAISAAATGHLVISTLHANTASECVNRIVSFFDPVERDLVRLQLFDSLQSIICQRLVPRIGGGRVPALEMMFKDTKAIGDGIRTGSTEAIRVGMQQTVSHSFLFENYLHRLYKEEKISLENARTYSSDPSILDQLIMGTYSVPRLDSIKHSYTA